MNIPYHLALRLGRLKRMLYRRSLARIASRACAFPGTVEVTLLCLVGKKDLPELVASVRSFFRYVGKPRGFVVATDGTLDAADLLLLKSLPFEPVIWWPQDYAPVGQPPIIDNYFREHPFGKKLALMLKAQELTPVIYADSDILFFPGADELRQRLKDQSVPGWFLLDCAFSLDRRMLNRDSTSSPWVNAGCVVFNRPVDFKDPINRFASLSVPGEFFTEQTIVHLAMTQAGCQPLPAGQHVLQNDDQWLWRDKYVRHDTVLRHYISSFRHKMWVQVNFGV